MEIRSLAGVDDEALCAAWQRAFIDYGMTVTSAQLLSMFSRRGYCAADSYGAFEGDQLVSFTLNCIDEYDGVASIYSTSTGTAKVFRRRGLAAEIFAHMLPRLKEQKIKLYVLEVLKQNTAAFALYTKMGFIVHREFYYFRQSVEAVKSKLAETANEAGTASTVPAEVIFTEGTLPELSAVQNMWDFLPSWQNSYASMQRKCCLSLIL
jgi:ribosomal protein S18 acetylase RimI-like enzyme